MYTEPAVKRLPIVGILLALAVVMLPLTNTMAQENEQVSVVPELAGKLERVEETASALERAEAWGDEPAIERARMHHRMAQREMEQNLARLAGVEPEEVAAMRQAGMGWGQIAQELNLHPGVLGLGHYQKETPSQERLMGREHTRKRTREDMEATSRGMKRAGSSKRGMAQLGSESKGTGFGKGHGSGHGAGGHGSGHGHGGGHK